MRATDESETDARPTESGATLVTIEGLPGPARDALSRAVAARLAWARGSDPADPGWPGDSASAASRWGLLAKRLARAPTEAGPWFSHGSWLDKAPRDPGALALYRRLAGAALRRRGVRLVGHVAVVLRNDPHEAFEDSMDQASLSLRALCRLDAWLGSPAAEAGLPCALRRLDVKCPLNLVDNPADLDRLAAFCAARLQQECARLAEA